MIVSALIALRFVPVAGKHSTQLTITDVVVLILLEAGDISTND